MVHPIRDHRAKKMRITQTAYGRGRGSKRTVNKSRNAHCTVSKSMIYPDTTDGHMLNKACFVDSWVGQDHQTFQFSVPSEFSLEQFRLISLAVRPNPLSQTSNSPHMYCFMISPPTGSPVFISQSTVSPLTAQFPSPLARTPVTRDSRPSVTTNPMTLSRVTSERENERR